MNNAHKWTTVRNEGKYDTKNNLDSFKAFLLLLKFHCMEKMEIYRTLIKLLHMYNPRDGYEAYNTLIQVICVLLVGIDSNTLNYLLSIIPLPQPCGQYQRMCIQEEVKRLSGMSLHTIPAFHSTYIPIKLDKRQESDSLNSISNGSLDGFNGNEKIFQDNGDVKIEEPTLKEYQLIEVTGNASDSLLNDIYLAYDEKNIDFTSDISDESFDWLIDEDDNENDNDYDDESVKINEEREHLSKTDSSAIYSVKNVTTFNLNPDVVLKESIQKFIANAYGSSSVEEYELMEENSKTPINEVMPSSGDNDFEKVPELVISYSRNNSASTNIMRSVLDDDDNDTDIEILEIEESSSIFEQGRENNEYSKLKQKNNKGWVQTDVERANDVNETLNEVDIIDMRDRIRKDSEDFGEQISVDSTLSSLQPFSSPSVCLIKEDEEDKLKQNDFLDHSRISNSVQSHGSQSQNTRQILADNVKTEIFTPAPTNVAEQKEHNDTSHILFSDHEWNKKNAKLLDIGLEQNEDIVLNKQDISVQNDISIPATIIPSIPIAHGFKRYGSYTSAEHLEYLHELALSKLAELKTSTDSDSCVSQCTPEAKIPESKTTNNYSKTETCQEIETTAIIAVSVASKDTHPRSDCRSSSETWSIQEMRTASLPGCHGMVAPRVPVNTTSEENASQCTGYNVPKMRSYVPQSLSKSNDSVPMAPLPPQSQLVPQPPPPPPQLRPASSSSLPLASPFSIAHSIPPKHATAMDGQEWIMKLPESRKSMDTMWPAYRPLYQPYTVYDSRFMQQRVQLSQRPVMIAQPQSSINPCLEQSHGCGNQYGGRFWGIYSPIPHRIFPRQTSHPAHQQRISTANVPDVVPHFIPHPTQRINTNHPMYLSQMSKMSPDIISHYSSHPTESKCKSLEEIVGRIKENKQ